MKKFCLVLVTAGLVLPLVANANEGSQLQSENNIKFYGFVRIDGTHDLGVSNTDKGDWASFLQTQPIEGTVESRKRGGSYLTARTSRLGLDGKLAGGAVGFKLEADFNGTTAEGSQPGRTGTNGTGLRIRHAYVEIQNWLLGQTWSNYTDLAGLPETVQFNPSLTAAAPRQAQVRYTINLPTSHISFALENGGSYTSASSNSDFDKSVDVTARWINSGNWGHISAQIASVGYSTMKDGVPNSARGYQAGLSGSAVVPNGKFVYGAFTGKGGGRYAWGSLLQGAVLTTSGISLFKSDGFHIGYTHNWSGTQRSNFAYSAVNFSDNPNATVNESNKKLSQMHLNLISSVAKNTELGIEYAYGKRTLMNPTAANYGLEKRLNLALTTMF